MYECVHGLAVRIGVSTPHVYTDMHVQCNVCKHVCKHACVYTHVCVYACVQTCMRIPKYMNQSSVSRYACIVSCTHACIFYFLAPTCTSSCMYMYVSRSAFDSRYECIFFCALTGIHVPFLIHFHAPTASRVHVYVHTSIRTK